MKRSTAVGYDSVASTGSALYRWERDRMGSPVSRIKRMNLSNGNHVSRETSDYGIRAMNC